MDICALERSINHIVSRNTIFQASFKPINGVLRQFEDNNGKVPLRVVSLTNMTIEVARQEAKRRIKSEAEEPFDLAEGPLIRTMVIECSTNEFYLVIVMHHIVTDLRTKDLFGTALSNIYNAYAIGSVPDLEEDFGQYSDYSHDCEKLEFDIKHQSKITYWKDKLKDREYYLNLPIDLNRPVIQSLKGKAYPFSLSQQFTKELEIFSKKNKVNVFLTLLSSFFILLNKYSNQDEITVGVPLTNRRNPKYMNVMGCFVNILPIMVRFTNKTRFSDVLKQVRFEMLAAHRNQEVGFQDILANIKLKRSSSHSPVFQTGFTFEHPMDIKLINMNVEKMSVHNGGSQLELFPIMWESSSGIQGYIEYCADLFSETSIERFAGHYKMLLQEILHNSDKLVSGLSLLTSKEQCQILKKFNTTQREYPGPHCIHSIFEIQAKKSPDATALIYDNEHLTYKTLNGRINQLANFLINKGIEQGNPVGILMERSIEMVITIFAIIKSGAAYVPLDPDYPEERITKIIKSAQIDMVLTQGHLTNLCDGLEINLINIETDWPQVELLSKDNPKLSPDPNRPAYIIFTSGTTGDPKGVIVSHRAISNRIFWTQEKFQLDPSDTVLQKTPFSFDVSVWEFFGPLLFGAKLVIAEPGDHQSPDRLVELINQHQITTIHFVPSMLQLFLENLSNKIHSCGSIKRVISSGETLRGDLANHFFSKIDAELHNLYGPTEAAIDVTTWQCEKNSSKHRIPIGRAVPNTTLYILDQFGQPVPINIPGELHIGGIQVAEGYLHRDDLTNEKFVPDPFSDQSGAKMYKTGDLARFLPDGNVDFLGRTDFQVKIRGIRVELEEIETVLCLHDKISKAVVIAKDFREGDRRIIAYIVLEDDAQMTSEFLTELTQWLKKKLPLYMIPASFIPLASIDLSPNGKVNRSTLPEPKIKRFELSHEYVAPLGDVESRLAVLWAEILGLDKVGIKDNFFDIGGNSLLAAYLISKIQYTFNKEISVVKIFQYPTVSSLALYLEQNQNIPKLDGKIENRIRLRRQAIKEVHSKRVK